MTPHRNPNTAFITNERQQIIQKLVRQGKNPKTPEALTKPSTPVSLLLHRLEILLNRLDNEVQMTPQFKEATKIQLGMEAICDEQNKFPEKYVSRAQALLKKWQSENWGAPVSVKRKRSAESENEGEVSDQGVGQGRKKRKLSNETKDGKKSKLLLPKEDHPIWGLRGIMHGICYEKSAGKCTQVLDPRYEDEKSPANVTGENGLYVGQWFSSQMVALFKGAHGVTRGGIHGNSKTGAYSVITSGFYDTLDTDKGDVLYYSGSGSHDNPNPNQSAPSKAGTLALKKSMETQEPVRVLRSAGGKTRWAPTKGVRYDGLYLVESMREPLNEKGGRYEQFKLVRMEDQDPITFKWPRAQDQHDFDIISEQYPVDKVIKVGS